MAGITSCTNVETAKEQAGGQEAIYREYSIWSEEGDEWVTGLFQVFATRKERRSMELQEPAKLAFDGEALMPDSAEVTGVFYEVQKPMDGFAGKHTITYTDANEKQYTDDFLFIPFRVLNQLGPEVSRSQLVLELEGLEEEELIRVVAVDTSFESDGINEMDTVRNGRLDLRELFDREIVNGPVMLQLFREIERPLKSRPGGGRISITYSLKKEFNLTE